MKVVCNLQQKVTEQFELVWVTLGILWNSTQMSMAMQFYGSVGHRKMEVTVMNMFYFWVPGTAYLEYMRRTGSICECCMDPESLSDALGYEDVYYWNRNHFFFR